MLFIFGFIGYAKQDSVFFYKNGKIIFSENLSEIDSLTFRPLDYYNTKSSLKVYEKILSDRNLSKFAEMLFKTGYHKQIYSSTVFAPVNSALENVESNNQELINSIVRNHISGNVVWTNQINGNDLKIKMINNKNYVFSSSNGTFRIDGKQILEYDIDTSDAVIHTINEIVPYVKNISEYISLKSEFDSIQGFYNSLSDTEKSYLGNINSEDSLFTAVIPENSAWNEALTKALPLFKNQTKNAKWYILRDLFFNGVILNNNLDTTITSAFGKVINNPEKIFRNITDTIKLSNGVILKTSSMNQIDSSEIKKTIRIEAESPKYRINFTCNTKSVSSEYNYLRCIPTTNSELNKVAVSFAIPDIIPGRYNIYVVIIPASYENPTDLRPNKLNFYINYIEENGSLIRNRLLASNITTDPNTINKINLGEVYFPNSSVLYDILMGPEIRIKIQNTALISELDNFTRHMLIDCIILEPVK